MGVPENEIFVAGNSKGYFWNLVKIDNYWYHVDALNYNYNGSLDDYKNFYQGRLQFFSYLYDQNISSISSNEWVIAIDRYGYTNELKNKPTTTNLNRYLTNNGLGSMAS